MKYVNMALLLVSCMIFQGCVHHPRLQNTYEETRIVEHHVVTPNPRHEYHAPKPPVHNVAPHQKPQAHHVAQSHKPYVHKQDQRREGHGVNPPKSNARPNLSHKQINKHFERGEHRK